MRLITGTSVLLYVSCVLAFVVPLIQGGIKPQLAFKPESLDWRQWGIAVLLFLGLYAVAFALHLNTAAGFPYFLGGMAGYALLGGFQFVQPGMRGLILLLIGLALTGTINDASALSLPLGSFLFGLTAGRFISIGTTWEDYWLPASWCIGTLWIAIGAQENMLLAYQSILAVFISIVLLLRIIQSFPLLSEKNPLILPSFIVITGGLAAWLCIQLMVIQPGLLKWVWMLAGGILLGFVLQDAPDTDVSERNSSGFLLRRAIQLLLIGIAALLASRLFGTLGWVVLAVGLLANLRASTAAVVAALFFLGRSLLQVFILQYNPNVTGINITHPYASAALYAGFSSMLLLPGLIGNLLPSNKTDERPYNPLAWALVPLAAAMAGGLSNYFLHAEATGSLLVALTVAGLGVALFSQVKQVGANVLLFPVLVVNSVLLTYELLQAGTEADKAQKILVLGGVLLLALLTGVLLGRGIGSGRKPVQVS
jgi:hypothetical protein